MPDPLLLLFKINITVIYKLINLTYNHEHLLKYYLLFINKIFYYTTLNIYSLYYTHYYY